MKSRSTFPLPNLLSSFRLILGLAIPFLVLRGALWTAFGLFLFGALTDFWDGWIARRHHLETPLGRILDPAADKVFILGAMVSFAIKGVYGYWYLVPIFLREVAVTFCRNVWLIEGHAIGAERAGKLKLGLQVTSVVFSFFYLMHPTRDLFYLNYFFLILALTMTLYSGYLFLRHNQKLLNNSDFSRKVAALGVGYLKPFPGTYGTLLGMVLLLAVAYDPLLHFLIFLTLLGLAYLAIPRIGLAPEEDPLEIVIDEVCGILLAFLFVPLHWQSLIVGFSAFRFFDVTKIFPLRWLEKRKGVHGIMLDDLGAGIYTWLVLKILFR